MMKSFDDYAKKALKSSFFGMLSAANLKFQYPKIESLRPSPSVSMPVALVIAVK